MRKIIPSDDELIERIKKGDESAKFLFYTKYMAYSKALAKEFIEQHEYYSYLLEDFASFMLINTESIVNHYETNKGLFYVYWKKIVMRRLVKYSKKFEIMSMDDANINEKSLHEIIGIENDLSRNVVMERLIGIISDKRTGLTSTEKQVMKLFLLGYSYKEISLYLHYSMSNVYRLYARAIDKISIALKIKR